MYMKPAHSQTAGSLLRNYAFTSMSPAKFCDCITQACDAVVLTQPVYRQTDAEYKHLPKHSKQPLKKFPQRRNRQDNI